MPHDGPACMYVKMHPQDYFTRGEAQAKSFKDQNKLHINFHRLDRTRTS
jgi:hypothetical protein